MVEAGTRPVMPWSVRTSTKCSRGFDGGVMIGSRSAFTPARYWMRCRPGTCTSCGMRSAPPPSGNSNVISLMSVIFIFQLSASVPLGGRFPTTSPCDRP